jgi:hypothetical protein
VTNLAKIFCTNFTVKINETTTILIKTLIVMTLLITLINVT